MPKLYEYLGLVIYFYSNEHEPIHVHGLYEDTEAKIEIFVTEGSVVKLKYKEMQGRKPLSPKNRKNFMHLTEILADEIVQSWINYFVLHKKIVPKRISGKL